jgi:hypothetical protein
MAWRFGGTNPFALYHGLDQFFRSFHDGQIHTPAEGGRRLKHFIYACAERAAKDS